MKVIILLGGFGSRMRPHTWSRPKPLLNVAGNTVLGHILDLMEDITTEEVIFVVGYKGDQIEAWVRENYPHLDTHFVLQAEALGQAHAVWLCRDFLADERDMVLAFGDGIIEADYGHIAEQAGSKQADAVFMVKEVADPRSFGVVVLNEQGYVTRFVEKPKTLTDNQVVVGINWFRSSSQLRDAVDRVMAENRQTLGEYFMADAYSLMLENGARIITKQVLQWSDAGQPQNILHTNARLLSVGFHTENAIERSYAEDFTVLPPVYLHPTATVTGSVIGPYVTVEANVTINASVIRNSIIDAGARVENCILDGALIGEKAAVTGRGKQLFIGDNSLVELD